MPFKNQNVLRLAAVKPIRVTGLVECWNPGSYAQIIEYFPNQLDEMVGWCLDCCTYEECEQIQGLNQAQILRLVDREYAGGLSAFILSNPADHDWQPIEVNTED
ncbi:gp095 [Rhodococcus phage ReqiDocB7]|uniref:gp095 n=1 Tax=Rhodococcus phage ReqiDocB7 TaxID=691966 RepID=UPI0001CDD878|nr:gp095 [Rhodococcus phage ReqiDocB7]ADD80881.1 gp095 [Rhodococcus phage ReqiDocB7]